MLYGCCGSPLFSGIPPATRCTPCSRASAESADRMGPGALVWTSSAAARFWSSEPISAKFSGSATSFAPARAASPTRHATRARFAATSS